MSDRGRLALRYMAAALSAAMAVIYLLIGLEVVRVANGGSADGSILVFGAVSASAFLLGALLLVFVDRQVLWALGGLFQLFAIAAYVLVAPQRDPSYEPWGIGLKIGQAVLLLALAWLALSSPAPTRHVRAIRRIPR